MNSTLTKIYSIALRLLDPIGDAETYATIIKETVDQTGTEYGSIFLADKKKKLERVYTTVPKNFQLEPRRNGFTYQAFRTGELIVVSAAKLRKFHPEIHSKPIKFIVIMPLFYGKKAFGVMTLQSSKPIRFSEKRQQILKLFGSLISLKIRNTSLYSELKNALEMRDLFISMASHELKTPLTTISAYSQLIQKKIQQGQRIDPQWTEVLTFATQRMTRLINELLHVNQIKTGKMPYQFSKTSLAEVINQALTDFKSAYSNHDIELHNLLESGQEFVNGDKSKLIQVVINILNNAAKFTLPEKRISVTLSQKNKYNLITIKDEGIGISKDDLEHLFEEFYKVDNNTKEGLGLGLFISKKILEAHRGKIKLKSELGKGTEVIISIPVLLV
jgi:signal transduction histidine kinase